MDALEEAVFRVAIFGNWEALLCLLRSPKANSIRERLEMIALIGCIVGESEVESPRSDEELSFERKILRLNLDDLQSEHRRCIDNIVKRNIDGWRLVDLAAFCKKMRREDLVAFFMEKSGKEGMLRMGSEQKSPRIYLIMNDENDIEFRPFTALMHSMSTIRYAEKNIQSFIDHEKSELLFDAISSGRLETVKYVVNGGAEVDWIHSSYASWKGFDVIRLYLNKVKAEGCSSQTK